MMRAVASLTLVLTLTGCFWNVKPEPQVVVKYKYVVTELPAELVEVPPQPAKIDPAAATDKETAVWMLESEKRYLDLQNKLKLAKEYQAKKLRELKVPPEDVIKQ